MKLDLHHNPDIGKVANEAKRIFAELIGTMVLSASILGSGMMATGITDNGGVQLIIVMLGTVLALGLLIATLRANQRSTFQSRRFTHLFFD